jgi:uncharacterized protein (TIRG00374 family)
MNLRRILVSIIALALLVWLAIHQFHSSPEWRRFSWERFRDATENANGTSLLEAVGLVYLGYLVRSLRWRILMTPEGRFWPVLKGNVIGFTGIAFFGRLGEFVRPYYIAWKTGSRMTPQVAILVLERIFDMASVVLLVALDLALSPTLSALTRAQANYARMRVLGLGMMGFIVVMIVLLILFDHHAVGVSDWVSRKLRPISASWSERIRNFLHNLSLGTASLARPSALVMAILYTVLMWLGIVLSLQLICRGYDVMSDFSFADALLLLGFTLFGSLVQLPVVGGGVQVMTVFALTQIFNVDPAPATSAALLIWLISFYSITPFGIALSVREGVSWRKITAEAEHAEEEESKARA